VVPSVNRGSSDSGVPSVNDHKSGDRSAPASRTCVVLIHGVGSSKAQVLEKSVEAFPEASGICGTEVHEYHWNSLSAPTHLTLSA